MSDKLVAATGYNAGNAVIAKTDARERVPTDLLSAICYLLLHSSLWRECARLDRARSLAREQQSTRARRLQPPRSDCDRSEFLTYVLSG